MSSYARVTEAAHFVRERAPIPPHIGVVLGSGLGDFASRVNDALSIPYEQIPHWPVTTVAGHAGRLVLGDVAGRPVAVLSGRVHAYEGYDLRAVTFPVRVMATLGVKTLVLTNAAGGVNPEFAQGTLMVIDDHLNLMGGNPLTGPNDDRLGARFPDMSNVYAIRLRAMTDVVAAELGISVRHGVYAALSGPSYETPAEIRYLRAIGADAVGMSTVPEAIVARHMGVDVLGVSIITNVAAGRLPKRLDHGETLEHARRVGGRLNALLEGIIARR
jgi:purine-nucleoside phosphorylase